MSESKTELAKAIIAVMKEVKGVEKNTTVGSGNYSYKGVSDKDVKEVFNKAMVKNGLCLLPIDVEPTIHISRWEEQTNPQYPPKQKQSVFTEVKTKYLLLHESGESQVLAGYGHGQDTMDKSSGKATTYALKYTLLYTFLTPTGTIDDADNEHSEEKPVPQKTKPQEQNPTKTPPKKATPKKKKMTKDIFDKAIASEKIDVLEKSFKTYEMTTEQSGAITLRIETLKQQQKGNDTAQQG